VNMYRKPARAEITVKGAQGTQAEVLFENRTVPVGGGTLSDDFAPYAVHRYRIK
jgi:hypothetical protein